ncbi:MAG: hypothetical protein DMG92_14070 [Acidobacteria bacterium]|nr:MAG: hypothetical protein DMG92_14070 [Acidobacteriota bacterium]
MERCGPHELILVGRLTPMATGFGTIRGDGPGSIMSLGVLLPFTMAAGSMTVASGVGLPVRFTFAHITLPR